MKLLHSFAKALLVAAALLAMHENANAEVYWEFQIGGMGSKVNQYEDAWHYVHGESDEKKTIYNILGGFNLFIPVSKSVPLLIETGIRYRYMPMQYKNTGDESDMYDGFERTYHFTDLDRDGISFTSAIEIPLKLNYEWRWSEYNSLRFGLGVYGQFMFGNYGYSCSRYLEGTRITEDGEEVSFTDWDSHYDSPYNKWSVGIQPSVTYSHRCVSFGVMFNSPVFYNGSHNRFGNLLSFTFGLKFKSGAWKYIGMGLGGVAMAAGGVAAVYNATQHNSSYNSSSSTDSYSSGSSSGSKGSGHYETMYYKWERQAENAWNSLADRSVSPSIYSRNKKLLREAQKEMRKYREEARKNGIEIPQSKWETAKIDI